MSVSLRRGNGERNSVQLALSQVIKGKFYERMFEQFSLGKSIPWNLQFLFSEIILFNNLILLFARVCVFVFAWFVQQKKRENLIQLNFRSKIRVSKKHWTKHQKWLGWGSPKLGPFSTREHKSQPIMIKLYSKESEHQFDQEKRNLEFWTLQWKKLNKGKGTGIQFKLSGPGLVWTQRLLHCTNTEVR